MSVRGLFTNNNLYYKYIINL